MLSELFKKSLIISFLALQDQVLLSGLMRQSCFDYSWTNVDSLQESRGDRHGRECFCESSPPVDRHFDQAQ